MRAAAAEHSTAEARQLAAAARDRAADADMRAAAASTRAAAAEDRLADAQCELMGAQYDAHDAAEAAVRAQVRVGAPLFVSVVLHGMDVGACRHAGAGLASNSSLLGQCCILVQLRWVAQCRLCAPGKRS